MNENTPFQFETSLMHVICKSMDTPFKKDIKVVE